MSTPTHQESQPGDFDAVKKSIIELLKQPEYDDGSAGPVIVRLAWYDVPVPMPLLNLNLR